MERQNYIVVRSPDIVTFEEQVNKKLSEGYTLVGGLCTCQCGMHGTVYCQSMYYIPF